MNVKKLIEKIEGLNKLYGEKFYVALDDVLDLAKQLDEPQKVKIPSVVAQWIGYAKGWNKGLHYALSNASDEVLEWLCVDKLKRQEIFARAWLDGYEVEKEKRYLVKLKGIFKGCEYLNFKFGRVWTFSNEEENEEYRTCHTKKELEEAGFGWVFDCPGIQIEEVKD